MSTQDKSFYLKQTEALKLALQSIEDGETGHAAQILREALAEQPAQQEPVSDRENAIIRFALHQFMSNAYSHMNAAAQDKDSRYYTNGAVEKFAKDAKDAEALLSRLQFKVPKPAQQQGPKKDLMYSTVAMQERHAAFVDRAVATLEQVKREALAEEYEATTTQEHVVECDCETATSPDGSRLTKCGSDQMRRAIEAKLREKNA